MRSAPWQSSQWAPAHQPCQQIFADGAIQAEYRYRREFHQDDEARFYSVMPRPDVYAAVQNLAMAFEHYNEWYLHSPSGYRSPRE